MQYYTCVQAIADHYDFYSQSGNLWEVIDTVHMYMMNWKNENPSGASSLHEALGLDIDEYLGVISDETALATLIMEKAYDIIDQSAA